jgi:RHS repeat-associated protein
MLGSSSTTPETSLLYCGEQLDSTLGMYNLRARFYDANNGRFSQRDAFAGIYSDPETLHKYLYSDGDPINRIDPSGYLSGSMIELNLVTVLQFIGVTLLSAVIWTVFQNAELGAQMLEANRQLMAAAGGLLTATGDGISEAYAAVTAAAAALISNLGELLKAVRNAINEALKLGRKTLKELIKIPKYLIVKSLGPKIFDFDVTCLVARPDWFLLDYLGPGKSGPNRTWMRTTYAAFWAATPPLHTVDEFPYASTTQGGPGGPALVHYAPTVPLHENAIQGGTLGVFYRFSGLRGRPGPFLVVPVPL